MSDSTVLDPQVWNMKEIDNEGGYIKDHHPCGHWHKQSIILPGPSEGLFVSANCDQYLYSIDKNLVETIAPLYTTKVYWCIAVDKDYVYIGNTTDNIIEKRSKVDLSLIASSVANSYSSYAFAVDYGYYLWAYGYRSIRLLNKSDMSLNTVYDIDDFGDAMGVITQIGDIAVDYDYLYATDMTTNCVKIYNKSSLLFITAFGNSKLWAKNVSSISDDGSYVWIASSGSNELKKIDKSTLDIVDTIGDGRTSSILGLPEDGYIYSPYGVFVNGSYVYTSGYFGIAQFNKTNGSYVDKIPNTDAGYGTLGHLTYQAVTDGSYIYACSFDNFISKWDITDLSFVTENGDRTGVSTDGPNAYYYIVGIAVDSTYVYVIDQNTSFRVIRRLKSDLSYVDEYTDAWLIFGNPQNITVDASYIYISDSGIGTVGVHRLDISTLAYVDFTDLSASSASPIGMLVDGSTFWVTNYTSDDCLAKYNLSGFSFVESSDHYTNYYGEEILSSRGITVDENYIYVCTYDNYVKIFNKTTFALIHSIDVSAYGGPKYPAVDSQYLYVICTQSTIHTPVVDYIIKFLKTSPYTIIDISSAYVTSIGIDTAWLYQLNYYPGD